MPPTSNVTSQWRSSPENYNISTGDHDPNNDVSLINNINSLYRRRKLLRKEPDRTINYYLTKQYNPRKHTIT